MRTSNSDAFITASQLGFTSTLVLGVITGAFTVTGLIAVSSPALAAPVISTWQSCSGCGSPLDWSRGGNWDNGRPDNSDGADTFTAVIDNGDTVLMNRGMVEIDRLRIGDSTASQVTIQADKTLRLVDGITTSGSPSLIGAGSKLKLEQGSALNIDLGAFLDNAGTIQNDGSLVNEGDLEFVGGGELRGFSGTLTNDEFLRFNDSSQMSAGTVVNNDRMRLADSAQMTAGKITNNDELWLRNDSDISGGRVTNDGDMLLIEDANISGGTVVNKANGVITRTHSGTTDVGGSIVNDGRLNITGTLNLVGTGELSGSGTVTNDNTLSLFGSSQISDGAVTNNYGLGLTDSSQISGGTVTNNSTLDLFGSSQISDGAVTNNYGLGLTDSSQISGGTVTNNNAMYLYQSSQISGGTVTNNYYLGLTDSSQISGGTVTNNYGLGLTDSSQISGGTLTNNNAMYLYQSSQISGGTVTNNSGGVMTRGSDGTSEIGGTVINDGSLVVQNTGTLEVLSNGTLTSSGTITNDGSLVNNSGAFNLTGGANLSGTGTTINDRRLALNDTSSISSGTLTNNDRLRLFDTAEISGGSVTNNDDLRLRDSSQISGGTVTNTINGVMTRWSGGTSTIGGAVINDGSLVVQNTGTLEVLSNGTLTSSGTITNDGSLMNRTETFELVGGGSLSGSGTTTNEGRLVLNDASSISSGTLTNNDRLRLFDTAEISGGSVTNNDDLRLRDSSQISGGTVTNTINGVMTRWSGGTSTIGGAVINDGSLVVQNTGTLEVLSAGTITTSGTITNNGTMTNNGSLTNDGTLNNAGVLGLNAGGTFDNTNGTLNNNDGGVLTLGADLTFGSTAAGVINLNDGSTLVNNAILTNALGHTQTVAGAIVNDNSLVNDHFLFFVGNGDLAGSGTVTNNRNLTLRDNATISGGSITNNKVLSLVNSSDITEGTIVNNDDIQLWSNSNMSGGVVTNTSSGVIERKGGGSNAIGSDLINDGLVKGNTAGAGLILTGSVSGSGSYQGDITFEGAFRPGNSPALISGETLNFGQNSSLFMEVGGYGRGTEYDAIDAITLSLDGTLSVDLVDLGSGVFTPAMNDSFDLITAGAIDGIFASADFSNAALDPGLVWNWGISNTGPGQTLSIDVGSSVISSDDFVVAAGETRVLNGQLSSGSSVTKTGAGSLVLVETQTNVSGTISVTDGTLGFGGETSLAGVTDLSVSMGAVFDVSRIGVDSIFAGDLDNQGLVQGGSGDNDLILTGTYGGAGGFGGNLVFDGVFTPGNSPALIAAENMTFGANSSLLMEIGGYGRGSEYDAFDAVNVTLGGLLDVALLDLSNGFTPMAGDVFDLIIADMIIGNFSTFSFASLSGGLYFTTNLISSGGQMIYQLLVLGESGPGGPGQGVPGPGTIFILVVGLAGFGAMRRKRTA